MQTTGSADGSSSKNRGVSNTTKKPRTNKRSVTSLLSNIHDGPGTVAANIAIAVTGAGPDITATKSSEARPKKRRIDDQVFKDKYTNCLKMAFTKLQNANSNVDNAKGM